MKVCVNSCVRRIKAPSCGGYLIRRWLTPRTALTLVLAVACGFFAFQLFVVKASLKWVPNKTVAEPRDMDELRTHLVRIKRIEKELAEVLQDAVDSEMSLSPNRLGDSKNQSLSRSGFLYDGRVYSDSDKSYGPGTNESQNASFNNQALAQNVQLRTEINRPHDLETDKSKGDYGRETKMHFENSRAKLIPKAKPVIDPSLEKTLSALFAKPIINPHSFTYDMNHPTLCKTTKAELLFIVPSAPRNTKRRKQFRNSAVYRFAENPANKAALIFFIGEYTGNSRHFQRFIDDENEVFVDIVQEHFKDEYSNIRLKAVAMLKWATTFCSTAKYVIRVDDDITTDPWDAVQAVYETGKTHDNFIIGHLRFNDKPVRFETSDSNEKYGVTYEEYPEEYYPTYALGGMLAYPMRTVSLLYEASLRIRTLWLDDVYITGICSKEIHASLLNHTLFVYRHDQEVRGGVGTQRPPSGEQRPTPAKIVGPIPVLHRVKGPVWRKETGGADNYEAVALRDAGKEGQRESDRDKEGDGYREGR